MDQSVTAVLSADRMRLSPRQKQVLELTAEGYDRADLAEAMFISKHTAIYHQKLIRQKMGARSMAQAVAVGFRTGVLQ